MGRNIVGSSHCAVKVVRMPKGTYLCLNVEKVRSGIMCSICSFGRSGVFHG